MEGGEGEGREQGVERGKARVFHIGRSIDYVEKTSYLKKSLILSSLYKHGKRTWKLHRRYRESDEARDIFA